MLDAGSFAAKKPVIVQIASSSASRYTRCSNELDALRCAMIFRKVSAEKSCTLTMCPGFTFCRPDVPLCPFCAIVAGAASSCVNSRAKRPAPATPTRRANALVFDEPNYQESDPSGRMSGTRVSLAAGTSTQCSRKSSSRAIADDGASFHLDQFNRHSIGSFDHGCSHVAPGVNLFENVDSFVF